MPTYTYHCDCPHDWEAWQPMADRALTRCGTCGGHAMRVLGPVRTHGVGSRGAMTRAHDTTEHQWDKDRPAYKRLRHAGLQPPHVDGADRLEALAKNDFEIDSGLRYGHIPEDTVKEGMGRARESGWKP